MPLPLPKPDKNWYKDETKLKENLPHLYHVEFPEYQAYKYHKEEERWVKIIKLVPEGHGLFHGLLAPKELQVSVSRIVGGERCVCDPNKEPIFKEIVFGNESDGQGKTLYNVEKGCTENGKSLKEEQSIILSDG